MAKNLMSKLSLEDELSSTVEPVDEVALAETQQECDNCVNDISSTVDDMEEAQELQSVLEDKDADLVAAQEPGASEMDQAVAIAAANEALSLIKTRLGIQDSGYTVSYESYREGGSSLTTAVNLSREGIKEVWETIKKWIINAINWISEKVTKFINLSKSFFLNLKKKESSLDKNVSEYGANGYEIYIANVISRLNDDIKDQLKDDIISLRKKTASVVTEDINSDGSDVMKRILKVIEGASEFKLTSIDIEVLTNAIRVNTDLAYYKYNEYGNMEEFLIAFLDILKTGFKVLEESKDVLQETTSVIDNFLSGDNFDQSYIKDLEKRLGRLNSVHYFPDNVEITETDKSLKVNATKYETYINDKWSSDQKLIKRPTGKDYEFKFPTKAPGPKTNSDLSKYFHKYVSEYNSLTSKLPTIEKFVNNVKKSFKEIDTALTRLNMTSEKSKQIADDNVHSLGNKDTKLFLDMYKFYLERLLKSSTHYLKACHSIVKYLSSFKISF